MFFIDWANELPEHPASLFLRARLASEAGEWTPAAAAWDRFFQLYQGLDPNWRFQHARALAQCGRMDEAALTLRRALSPVPKYSLFTRAEKLIQKLSSSVDTHLREARIAFLGPYTTAMLIPVVQALALRDRVKATVYAGMYGAVDVEILNPQGKLEEFQPDITVLLTTWRELKLPATVDNEESFVDEYLSACQSRWKQLADRFGCHVIQLGIDYPQEEPYGYLAGSLAGGRTRVIERINQRMIQEAPNYVSVLDTAAVQRETGAAAWQDAAMWYSFQQHPSTEALPALADALMAHVRAVLGLTRKVVVTDLDNTLWAGVIGEDGLHGIKVGPGSPKGEAHAGLQRYLLELKARGILLAVASKNNHEDAALPFLRHEHMLLRMEDFAAFEANWNDKASSIREIARKLNLGTDSFVFLDDNPIEREWVRSQLPEVGVVELGPSVYSYVRELDATRAFFAVELSQEDKARAGQYRSESARRHLQSVSQSLDEFLAQLQLKASCSPVSAQNIGRVTQLTNKTNQFNLTTRRYTEKQVETLAQDPACWAGAFSLADRMGEYGLIGVIFCRQPEAGVWNVDTWLMSCRVLGRQMEKFMFDRLVEAAQASGISEIHGVFRQTEKNRLVEQHYDGLGFERISDEAGERHYRYRVPAEAVRTATHITIA